METSITKQRSFFDSQATKPVQFRVEALKKMQAALRRQEQKILYALRQDLNKSEFEGYMTEVGMVLEEIGYALKHLSRWTRPQRKKTPLSQFPAKSVVLPEPYGVVLIMAPWNYPFQLSFVPLVGALAAGNCAVIKPSAYAPATSQVIAELIADVFPPEYVNVVQGGREQNAALLDQPFDYIFFTGSVSVGKLVMERASQRLTPVSLELGGKSPCIVDQTADLQMAARRIAFGKFLNSGQTCVAPDYLLVHHSVKDKLLTQLKRVLEEFFPDGKDRELPVIVNDRHFKRLAGLMQGERIAFGGEMDEARRWIQPTILTEVTWQSPVMQEEIFGPILPVLTFSSLDEAIENIAGLPKPLALYLFTRDKHAQKEILGRIPFGGGCVNDTIVHLTNPHLGFGGVGQSGMGCYHGKNSFDTFTHYKSVMKKANWLDLPMRYQPYTEAHFKWVKRFMK